MAPWECCGALEGNSRKMSIQPYSDISGKGILIAFLGSTYLALVLLIGNYLMAFDPTANPFATEPDSGDLGTSVSGPRSKADAAEWWRPNPVDCLLLGWVRRKKGPWHAAGKAFVKCIVDISDLQLLTGLSVLTTGFISLRCGSKGDAPPVSAYHWQMVVNLAWFSTIMHLAALSVLRTHFRRHPRTRILHFLLSLLLLTLLLAAMWPTIFFNWRGGSGLSSAPSAANMSSNAICFYDYSYGVASFEKARAEFRKYEVSSVKLPETMAVQEIILSEMLLLAAFATRTVKLFNPLSALFTSSLRKYPSKTFREVSTKLLKSTYPSKSRPVRLTLWRSFCLWPCVAAFYWGRIVLDVSSSILLELIGVLVSVLWGTLKLFDYRDFKDSDIAGIALEENKFTFGQVLPLLLLTASACSLGNSFFSELKSSSKSSSTNTSTHDPGNNSTASLSGESSSRTTLTAIENEWDLNATMTTKNPYASTPWLGSCVSFLTLQLSVPTLILLGLHNADRLGKYRESNRPSQTYLAIQFLISFVEIFCIVLVRVAVDKTAPRSHKKVKRLVAFNVLLVSSFLGKIVYLAFYTAAGSTLDPGNVASTSVSTVIFSTLFIWVYLLHSIFCFTKVLVLRRA
ncbi:hypothetical protein MAPG_11129 [Magnaporthiopsis poae ATCC 64411]|uniref:Uncharacterized protein n=1 Tax=Magnaporthiopsis poae (strain ATCC 64411 / 73-15) TaxID=644358 RepID=A0A0C4EEF6_MAGP6|nr:hypothetical protein MAPG_11129 [Magnaporthiopsis poae ATCC 64411]